MKEFKITYGVTHVHLTDGKFYITHGGNMGSTKEKDVIPNCTKIFGVNPFEHYKVLSEEGSPDYWYEAVLSATELNLTKLKR